MTSVDRRKRRDYLLMAIFAVILLGCIMPAKLFGNSTDDTSPTKPSVRTSPTPTTTTSPSPSAVQEPAADVSSDSTTARPSPTRKTVLPDPTEGEPTEEEPTEEPVEEDDSEEVAYYANCAAARRAGAAPLFAGEPGYRKGLDRDGDGIACDS